MVRTGEEIGLCDDQSETVQTNNKTSIIARLSDRGSSSSRSGSQVKEKALDLGPAKAQRTALKKTGKKKVIKK